jgi:hypothetical protein
MLGSLTDRLGNALSLGAFRRKLASGFLEHHGQLTPYRCVAVFPHSTPPSHHEDLSNVVDALGRYFEPRYGVHASRTDGDR